MTGIAFVSITFAATPLSMTIKKAAAPPKLDGIMDPTSDPWTAAGWIKEAQVVAGNTTSDASAQFQLMYDDKNIYFIAEVSDQTMGDTSYKQASWALDCVEFMISLDWSDTSGTMHTGCYQLREMEGFNFPKGFDGTVFGTYGTSFAGWMAHPRMKIAHKDGAAKYTQEWQVPWDSLMRGMEKDSANIANKIGKPQPIKSFKWETQSADNTGSGRTQQMFWADNSNSQWNNTKYQGIVTLATPVTVKSVSEEASDIYVCPTMVQDILKISKVSDVTIYNITGQEVMNLQKVNRDRKSVV